jgi:hypothetical protein
MTVEQCARELANLLQSGQPPSPHQVSALIQRLPQGSGARQMDLNRYQLAEAFKEVVPDSEHELILRRILPDDRGRARAGTHGSLARVRCIAARRAQ